jgi:hypothetical protein
MYTQSFHTLSWSVIGLCFGLALSSPAAAKCGCPDDGHGKPKLETGLGEAFPQAPDLAPDRAWQVYEFERDGIRYVQINDAYGRVRAAVGRIDDTFWVMPIGKDADRVNAYGNGRSIGQTKVLVRNGDLEVVLKMHKGAAYWRIGAP